MPSHIEYVLDPSVKERFPLELDFLGLGDELKDKKDVFKFIAKNFNATFPENAIVQRKMDDYEKNQIREEYCHLQENVLSDRKRQLEETLETIKVMKRDAEEAYMFVLSEIARYAAIVKEGVKEMRLKSTDTFCMAIGGYYLTYVWDGSKFVLAQSVQVPDPTSMWANEDLNREAMLNLFGVEFPEIERPQPVPTEEIEFD